MQKVEMNINVKAFADVLTLNVDDVGKGLNYVEGKDVV